MGAVCHLNEALCRLGPDLARFTVKCRSARPNITPSVPASEWASEAQGKRCRIDFFGGSIQRWHYTNSGAFGQGEKVSPRFVRSCSASVS